MNYSTGAFVLHNITKMNQLLGLQMPNCHIVYNKFGTQQNVRFLLFRNSIKSSALRCILHQLSNYLANISTCINESLKLYLQKKGDRYAFIFNLEREIERCTFAIAVHLILDYSKIAFSANKCHY